MDILQEIEKLGTVSEDHWARLREILKQIVILKDTTAKQDPKKKKKG